MNLSIIQYLNVPKKSYSLDRAQRILAHESL